MSHAALFGGHELRAAAAEDQIEWCLFQEVDREGLGIGRIEAGGEESRRGRFGEWRVGDKAGGTSLAAGGIEECLEVLALGSG